MSRMRAAVSGMLLGLTGCTGLGEFPTPSCDDAPQLQRLSLPAEIMDMTSRETADGLGMVLRGSGGEPRAIAALGRSGAWQEHALDARALCGDLPAAQGCKPTQLELAPLADAFVLAIVLQLEAADCNRMRLVLGTGLPELSLRGDAAGSLYAGVHLDERGCTQGGVHDARVAALATEPRRDALLVWRSDEPLVAAGACQAAGEGYVAALGVSVPGDGLGLFSEERESLRCLGVSGRAPSVVAVPRAGGYFVGLLASDALHILFVPSYDAAADGGQVVERASLPLSAANADQLELALDADGLLLSARWIANDDAHLATFAVADAGALALRMHSVLEALPRPSSGTQLLRVNAGLLDWSSYQSDAGWLLLWLSGRAPAARLHAARISDRTGRALGEPLELAHGALSMPFTTRAQSGDVYGFVRRDETEVSSERAELSLTSVACVVAARL